MPTERARTTITGDLPFVPVESIREPIALRNFVQKLLVAGLPDEADKRDSATLLRVYTRHPYEFDVTISRPAPDAEALRLGEQTFLVALRDTDLAISDKKQIQLGFRVTERETYALTARELHEEREARALRGEHTDSIVLNNSGQQESSIIIFAANIWNSGRGNEFENLGGVRLVRSTDKTVRLQRVEWQRGSVRYSQYPLELPEGITEEDLKAGYTQLMEVLRTTRDRFLPSTEKLK